MRSGLGVGADVVAHDADGELIGERDTRLGLETDRVKGGSSASAKAHNGILLCVEVVARDAQGNITGVYKNPYDLGTQALAQFMITNILDGGTLTITDTTNTGRSVTVNSAATIPMIVAGTGSTAAAFTDYHLTTIASGGTYGGSNSSGNQAAVQGSISSNTFTVTGTITNISGGTIAYAEIGISNTVGAHTFLLAHDVFTALSVSASGTLAVTYTFTFT